MKYVVIFLAVIALAKIDMIILGFEKIGESLKKTSKPAPVVPTNIVQSDDHVSIKEDKAIGRTPKSEFFTLLDDFHLNPSKENRMALIDLLRKHPTILGPKLDTAFEGEIFKMVDLIYNKSPELPLLLVDLLSVLQGENYEMIKRFSAILLDNDPDRFFLTFARSKDSNCSIAGLMGFRVPDEELFNEYVEREDLIAEFQAKEKIDPSAANYARICMMVLKMQLNKLSPPDGYAPAPAAAEPAPATQAEPEPAPAPAPAPTPAPAPVTPAPAPAPAPMTPEEKTNLPVPVIHTTPGSTAP